MTFQDLPHVIAAAKKSGGTSLDPYTFLTGHVLAVVLSVIGLLVALRFKKKIAESISMIAVVFLGLLVIGLAATGASPALAIANTLAGMIKAFFA